MFHQGRGGTAIAFTRANDHFVQNDRVGAASGRRRRAAAVATPADGGRPWRIRLQISKDEYPDLPSGVISPRPTWKKNQYKQLTEFKTHRAGYTANGVPANISVVRSLQNSLARRTAMTAGKDARCTSWKTR
ncbi:DUF444 family protein [Serratia ureilytica]